MNVNREKHIHNALMVLQPTSFLLIDESHKHAGHAGAATGLSHYAIEIESSHFEGVSPIERHRLIYKALGSLMQTDIHALRIIRATPPLTQEPN